jgi:hypothetical protein
MLLLYALGLACISRNVSRDLGLTLDTGPEEPELEG